MKTLISTLFFSLFFGFFTVQAQDKPKITGATEACVGCERYTVEGGPFGFELYVSYLANPNTDDCFEYTLDNQNGAFTVCYNCVGTYFVEVWGSNNGILVTDSVLVIVTDNLDMNIYQKDSLTCQQINPQDECEKACSGATITYGFLYPNPLQVLGVDVVGATSYFVDEARGEITVTWGNSSFGSINLTTQEQGLVCYSTGFLCVEISNEAEIDFLIPGFDFCVGESVELTL